jgi:hypothetical protein
MIETNAYQECPECHTIYELTGADIGGTALLQLPRHYKENVAPRSGLYMLPCESLNDPECCPCSEHLVPVRRPDEQTP